MWDKLLAWAEGVKTDLIVAGLVVLFAGGLYAYAHHQGAASEQVVQVKAILHQTNVARKAYAKIDKMAPDGSDKSVAAKWLQARTRSN
jgi:hypothetical protein